MTKQLQSGGIVRRLNPLRLETEWLMTWNVNRLLIYSGARRRQGAG